MKIGIVGAGQLGQMLALAGYPLALEFRFLDSSSESPGARVAPIVTGAFDDVDGTDVLAHLMLNVPNYYGDMTQRHLAVELADYLAKRLDEHRPDEASAARILRDLIQNQRLG